MKKIRKGDDVIILAGKDRGKRGQVLKVLPSQNLIVIEGLNKVKKHVKPNPVKGQVGGIVEQETPVHLSNVALFNSTLNRGQRIRFQSEGDKKNRQFVSGELVSA